MKKSKSVNLKKLNKELEEVKKEMEFYYLQGHNDETLNRKYHKLLSEINGTKLSRF
ncbi:hypothetical protein elemo89A_phanotate8 [Flavobacterium phage vB_FspP_elemoA_8-9A]|nr:hypothetical protein elemo75A_phanotate8 [Flavobacterium phage vB_FspP_elemoA_7-5A]QMP89822.1 hypothetical protein elemo89A_phanotate8 [Flavobacterium phage vB_FspP_elemoA_8-9A]